jgi:tetratricopeptide (TPR) repeat protein
MSSVGEEAKGLVALALKHGEALLARSPELAEAQAREILHAVPGEPRARLLLARALRRKGDARAALETAENLVVEQPRAAAAHLELALACAAAGDGRRALRSMETALSLKSAPNLWRILGDELTKAGEAEAAGEAYTRHVASQAKDPELLKAAAALARNDIPVAERALKDYLKRFPTDAAAIRMLAETAMRLGRVEDAATLLERCLELAPGFDAARQNYATALARLNRPVEALAEVDCLLASQPEHIGYKAQRASTLVRIGEYQAALTLYDELLARVPDNAKLRMSHGHALKTVGRTEDAIAAYERSIELAANLGEAYWSLANLKTYRFSPAQIEAMRAQLARGDLSAEDRYHLDFALGKALEDQGDYEASFRHYSAGNRLRRTEIHYDPVENRAAMKRAKALYTAEFLAERADAGHPAPDPIFIVGLPRAGSTLIEQILSSHSLVEGTMELPDMIAIARRLGHKRGKGDGAPYPASIGKLSRTELRAIGEEYLERTRVQRKTEKPFFIDKMPNNFVHTGMILLALPGAKIVDARRHPLACCFSAYKQHFARGQSFTYDLAELGAYYRDYVDLMAHFDRVAPGRVHRVFHERLVERFEGEVRRLLAYCELPFEEACLRFYETERAVRTASSEQVRRPIFSEGLEQWRLYDTWLEPLKKELGDVLDNYPEIPAF